MSVINKRVGGAGALSAVDGGKAFVLEQTIDFAENGPTAADVVYLFNIPAKTFVLGVQADIETLEGDTCTVDIGDYSAAGVVIDADGYFDGLDLNDAVGDSFSAPGVLAEAAPPTYAPTYSKGKYYSAASILTMLVNNTSATAKVTVRAVCIPLV